MPLSPVGKVYLLAFSDAGVQVLPLPEQGAAHLVAGPPLQIVQGQEQADAGASVAQIVVSPQQTTIRPTRKPCPLRLNGHPLAEQSPLAPGASLQWEDQTLVFHQSPRGKAVANALDAQELDLRLRQEVERALRYGRSLSVLVLETQSAAPAVTTGITEAVLQAVRFVDIVGWVTPQEYVLLFPETDQNATKPARRVLDTVLPLAPQARAGLAQCPVDGTDAETLLAGARDAAQGSAPGQVTQISQTSAQLALAKEKIVVVDPKMKRLFATVRQLAQSDMPVLIAGETGAGKEIVARAIHDWSPRREARLVTINCAAVSESLLESELFGHEKGAFTGAVSSKVGLLESANGGTVFLDEVSESSPRTQAELLRVLETKRLRRVGSVEEIQVDVRLVAATNRRLEEEIRTGRFRQDLYYRLNAAPVVIPPLRDRMLDLPALARFFLAEACSSQNRPPVSLAEDALFRLHLHQWPGNVRELRNLMGYLLATVQSHEIRAEHLPDHVGSQSAPWLNRGRQAPVAPSSAAPSSAAPSSAAPSSAAPSSAAPSSAGVPPAALSYAANSPAEPSSTAIPPTGSLAFLGPPPAATFPKLADEIRELERTRMTQALEACDGVRVRAADLIGMPLRTFVTKLKQYGLSSIPSTARKKKRPTTKE